MRGGQRVRWQMDNALRTLACQSKASHVWNQQELISLCSIVCTEERRAAQRTSRGWCSITNAASNTRTRSSTAGAAASADSILRGLLFPLPSLLWTCCCSSCRTAGRSAYEATLHLCLQTMHCTSLQFDLRQLDCCLGQILSRGSTDRSAWNDCVSDRVLLA